MQLFFPRDLFYSGPSQDPGQWYYIDCIYVHVILQNLYRCAGSYSGPNYYSDPFIGPKLLTPQPITTNFLYQLECPYHTNCQCSQSCLLLTTTIPRNGRQPQAIQATANFVFISLCYRIGSLARFCSSTLPLITITPYAKLPKPYAILMAISIFLEKLSTLGPMKSVQDVALLIP